MSDNGSRFLDSSRPEICCHPLRPLRAMASRSRPSSSARRAGGTLRPQRDAATSAGTAAARRTSSRGSTRQRPRAHCGRRGFHPQRRERDHQGRGTMSAPRSSRTRFTRTSGNRCSGDRSSAQGGLGLLARGQSSAGEQSRNVCPRASLYAGPLRTKKHRHVDGPLDVPSISHPGCSICSSNPHRAGSVSRQTCSGIEIAAVAVPSMSGLFATFALTTGDTADGRRAPLKRDRPRRSSPDLPARWRSSASCRAPAGPCSPATPQSPHSAPSASREPDRACRRAGSGRQARRCRVSPAAPAQVRLISSPDVGEGAQGAPESSSWASRLERHRRHPSRAGRSLSVFLVLVLRCRPPSGDGVEQGPDPVGP